MRSGEIKFVVLTTTAFFIGIYFYPSLPDSMATYWGSDGKPNDYSPKPFAAFISPVIMGLVSILFSFLPRRVAKPENLDQFTTYFDHFAVTFIAFFFAIHLFIIGWSLGYGLNITFFLPILLGPLFYSIGHMIENLNPKWSEQSALQWPPLSEEKRWELQKRLGPGFKMAGMIIFASSLAPKLALSLSIATIVGIILWTFYILFQAARSA